MADEFVRKTAMDDLNYYLLEGVDFDRSEHPTDNDLDALHERYIAVTPLQFDMTQYTLLEELNRIPWKLDL